MKISEFRDVQYMFIFCIDVVNCACFSVLLPEGGNNTKLLYNSYLVQTLAKPRF
jgi:hypothetical protein